MPLLLNAGRDIAREKSRDGGSGVVGGSIVMEFVISDMHKEWSCIALRSVLWDDDATSSGASGCTAVI